MADSQRGPGTHGSAGPGDSDDDVQAVGLGAGHKGGFELTSQRPVPGRVTADCAAARGRRLLPG